MKAATPRLRMFAGPNGSGKSTFKSVIGPELLGVYINPDEIEKKIAGTGCLDMKDYEVETTAEEISAFFTQSPFLAAVGLAEQAVALRFDGGCLFFDAVPVNSYYASVVADFIRRKLLEADVSFTFETVMSSRDKVEFLMRAQEKGFRTYLYYMATEDPAINVSRVENRVSEGGHAVPKDKIIARYHRSLALLADAVQYTNRAYIFDNSTYEKVWIAEVTEGIEMELKSDTVPYWFKAALWDKFSAPGEPTP